MIRKDCDNQRFQKVTRPKRLALMVASVALAWFCAPATAETIRVWPTAVIDTDQVYLGDIAVIDGFAGEQTTMLETLVVVPAPPAGKNRVVVISNIREALRAARFNMATVCLKGSSRCVVRRPVEIPKLQTETQQQKRNPDEITLREQMRRHLEDSWKEYGGRVEVNFVRTPPSLLELSGPEYAFDIRRRGNRKLGTIDLVVTIRRELEAPQTAHVTVIVRLRREVVVATTNIDRQQVIDRDDVLIEERSFKKLDQIGMTSIAGVVGQEAKRLVRAGDMIRKSDIKSVPLVKRNELVRIRSVSNGIVIESSAKALQTGALGEVIEVRNEVSKETYRVRVTGLRQAEVLAGPSVRVSKLDRTGGTP